MTQMQYTVLWGGEDEKHWKFNVQYKHGGTIYHKHSIPNTKTVAAATVHNQEAGNWFSAAACTA